MTLPFDEWIKREDYGDVEQLKRAFEAGIDLAKEQAEHAYLEACGDSALQHINFSKWELETAIKSRERVIEKLTAALDNENSMLTVHILRTWDRAKIERFALHLLGDEAQEEAARVNGLLSLVAEAVKADTKTSIEKFISLFDSPDMPTAHAAREILTLIDRLDTAPIIERVLEERKV